MVLCYVTNKILNKKKGCNHQLATTTRTSLHYIRKSSKYFLSQAYASHLFAIGTVDVFAVVVHNLLALDLLGGSGVAL